MVGGVVLSAIVLTGCFGTAKEKKTEEFAVASCNDYVKLMRCVADKSGENNTEWHAIIDQAITAWKNLPEADLQLVCTQALDTAAAYASTYASMGCDVPNVVITDETGATTGTSGEVVDTSVVETISWEVENSSTPSVTVSDEKTSKDAEVVSGIVDGITGSSN